MQTVIGTGNTGFGPLHYQRGGIIHRHQPRDSTKKKTASSNTFKRNDFLTGRFLPVSSDFYMEDPKTETSINLSTRKNFDYLYRSAVNYVNLLGLNLPYPKKKRSSYPRIDIIRLYEVMENLLPENVNLEFRDGRLTFCLYHFHKWPDYELLWLPLNFTEKLNHQLKRITLEFIRRFARHHGIGDITDTYYYDMSGDYLLLNLDEDSQEFSPKEKKRIKNLINSYDKGKIARLFKRMYGKSFCTDMEKQLYAYKPKKKSEEKFVELLKEGMTLMGKEVPGIMDYQYDWINEKEPDFLPATLDAQITLVYSLNDEVSEEIRSVFNADMQESYNFTPVTTLFLTPETDRIFKADDFPEQFADWFSRFVYHITHEL